MKLIILFLILFMASPVLAKRSGGMSGGRSFSSRSSSSSSSSSSYSGRSSSSYNHSNSGSSSSGGSSPLLLLLIVFAIFFISSIAKTPGSLSFLKMKIKFKNDEDDKLFKKLLKANSSSNKNTNLSEIFKLMLDSKYEIEVSEIEIDRNISGGSAKKLFKKNKKEYDKLFQENQENQDEEYVTVAFLMNFIVESAPVFAPELHRGKENIKLIEELAKIKLSKKEVWSFKLSLSK